MRSVALLLSVLAACSFSRTGVAPGDDDDIDAAPPPIDAATCSTTPVCADEVTVSVCGPDGMTPMTTTCAWGCKEDGGAHCGVLQPTAGGVVPGDLDVDPLLVDADMLTATIDTTNGSISGIRGAGTGVVDGIGYEVNNGVAVFRFKNVHVTGPLAIGGQFAVAIVATGSIQIDGLIDVRGPCTGGAAGPGGFPGGSVGVAAQGPGAGVGGTGIHNDNNGGGGAGHGVTGSPGGRAEDGDGDPGGPYGETFNALVGGSGGGSGGGPGGGVGGGGGGAIQLVAGTSMSFGATGGINAGGCGGRRNATNQVDGGGGGGSGGTILLEAPVITLAANAVLAVNGGGGGGADLNGGNAGAGQPSRMQAVGGNNGGGRGGSGLKFEGDPGGQTSGNGAGGGGAVGRIRIETRAGNATTATIDAGAILSPSLADPATTTSSVKATVL